MAAFHEETKRVIRHLQRSLIPLVDTAHSPELLKQAIFNYLEQLLRVGPLLIDNEELLGSRAERRDLPKRIPGRPSDKVPDIVYPFCGRDPHAEHILSGEDDGLHRYTTPKDSETLLHGIRIPPGCDVVELPSIKPHVRDFFFVDGNVRHFVSIDDRPIDDREPVTRVSFHSTCPQARATTSSSRGSLGRNADTVNSRGPVDNVKDEILRRTRQSETCPGPIQADYSRNKSERHDDVPEVRDNAPCANPLSRSNGPSNSVEESERCCASRPDTVLQRTYAGSQNVCRTPPLQRKVQFQEPRSHLPEEAPRARRRLQLSDIKLPLKDDSFDSCHENELINSEDVLEEYERYLRQKYLKNDHDSSDSNGNLADFEKQFRRRFLQDEKEDPHRHDEESLAEYERKFRQKHGLPGADPPKPMYSSCGPWSCGRRNSCTDPYSCQQNGAKRNVNFQLPSEDRRAESCVRADSRTTRTNEQAADVEDNVTAFEKCLRDKYQPAADVRDESGSVEPDSSQPICDNAAEFEKQLKKKYGLADLLDTESNRPECAERDDSEVAQKDPRADTDQLSMSELERCVKRVLGESRLGNNKDPSCVSDANMESVSEESLTRELLKVKGSNQRSEPGPKLQ